MKSIIPLACVALVAAVACDRAADPPPFHAVADMRQLMASVVEPAAEVFWDAVGSVEDSTGITSLAPRSSDEWDLVRNAAYVVTESGNLMMMAPRARPEAEWMKLSRAMIESGKRAIAAAESRDTTAVFDVGAELYETCTHCHAFYAIGQPRPVNK